MSGKVFLVGAGPGDPSLLTVRAAELLARADVLVLDALVSTETASRINARARIVYAGKRAAAHTLKQEEINALLIAEARKGFVVVRLKGGDPFVFGRGGEEAEELRRAGVDFEIVPGVTSAIAGPAYAGIPVTHRAFATSFTVVTGHESDDSQGVDWDRIAQTPGTLVLLMGLANLDEIARRLISGGKPAGTAIAVISRATTPRQRTVIADLATISDKVREKELEAPALIVVGEVVTLRNSIEWFESKPLYGRRIIVTRARAQASVLARHFEDEGAEVQQFPLIEIHPPESFDSLDNLIETIDQYDWLIFTSVNGVDAFFRRLREKGLDTRSLARSEIAAVGETTVAELLMHGVGADICPEEFRSAALLPLLPMKQTGVRTAVVRAEAGDDELLDELRRRGGSVDLAIAYRTVASGEFAEEIRSRVMKGSVDVITFSSSSTVSNFTALFPDDDLQALLNGVCIASIGPVTSAALRKQGIEVTVEASSADVRALAETVSAWFASAR